jgi:hypothetical protein
MDAAVDDLTGFYIRNTKRRRTLKPDKTSSGSHSPVLAPSKSRAPSIKASENGADLDWRELSEVLWTLMIPHVKRMAESTANVEEYSLENPLRAGNPSVREFLVWNFVSLYPCILVCLFVCLFGRMSAYVHLWRVLK